MDTSDTIFEQVQTEYDLAGGVIATTRWSRLHTATATGPLTASDARTREAGTWYDGVGRQLATADYGAGSFNRGTVTTVPPSTATVLVGSTVYDDAGNVFQTIDPAGKVNQSAYDAAGRTTQKIENYTADPQSDCQNITTSWTYTADGQVATLTFVNSLDGAVSEQVTRYVYGTDLGNDPAGRPFRPDIYRNDLLRAVIYPDSNNTPDLEQEGTLYDHVESWYNRQGELVQTKDQNSTVHQYTLDGQGHRSRIR